MAQASVADLDTKRDENKQHIISGYCSDNTPFISRIDRFGTSFRPEGVLLICHNYDSPGKIGVVGSILGKEDVNINYMSVAPANYKNTEIHVPKIQKPSLLSPSDPGTPRESTEALMILGVDREVDDNLVKALVEGGGVLSCSSVVL